MFIDVFHSDEAKWKEHQSIVIANSEIEAINLLEEEHKNYLYLKNVKVEHIEDIKKGVIDCFYHISSKPLPSGGSKK